MSEEKDSYNFDVSEEELPSEEFTTEIEESKIEPQYKEPVDTAIEPIDPEAEAKKKKRRKILIIIFAITLPIVLALVSLGFLIWGLVVGFTNCISSCGDACNECFGCCNSCNSCANCCNDCSDSCANCGSSCDSCTSCCGSSESVIKNANLSTNNKYSSITVKESLQTSAALLKWYFYRLYDFIENLFFK